MIAMHVAIWYVLHLEYEVKLLFVTESCHGSFRRPTSQVRPQFGSCGITGGHKQKRGTFFSYCFGISLPFSINAAYSSTHHRRHMILATDGVVK